MNVFHVMIATERRVSTEADPRELASAVAGQLHMTQAKALNNVNDPNILYASEWDQTSPWITVHKGSIADIKDGGLGWPTVTQAEWQAANPVVTP